MLFMLRVIDCAVDQGYSAFTAASTFRILAISATILSMLLSLEDAED